MNARVEMLPMELESIVRAAVAAAAGTGIRARFRALSSLQPGPPNPSYRYAEVIQIAAARIVPRSEFAGFYPSE